MGLSMAEPHLCKEVESERWLSRSLRDWFAVQVVPRHEQKVTMGLQQRQFETFLPLFEELHRWSDRRKRVEMPLFAGYTFVAIPPGVNDRVAVLRTPGVIRLVGATYEGTPIPEKQIEDIRLLVHSRLRLEPHPFARVGDRVRIRTGCLEGVEGILVGKPSEGSLLVSLDILQRSVAVRINGFDIEKVSSRPRLDHSLTVQVHT